MNAKLFALALVVAAGVPVALAEPAAGDPVLQGPKVVDGGVPGTRRPFGDGQGGDNKQRLADRPMPQMEFMRAVGALRDESTPENLRLTEEQQAKIKAINQDFEQSMRAFRDAHKGEFEEMRGKFGDRGRPPRGEGKPGPDANGDQMAPPPPPPSKEGAPADGAVRQRFEELRAQAPSPKDAQAKIFAVLTDEQKPIVQERLETIKKTMAERGMEGKAREEVRRRIQKQNEAGGAQGKFDPANLPPKLQERLANMTPEEREQAIQRFRERGGRGGPDAKRPAPIGGPEALPADLRETWESMTPEERQFLMEKLREKAREEGRDIPPPRRRPRPPQDGSTPPPPPPPAE
ncbi:MAG: hypothetical protein JNK16_07675 [Phycisphaerales bacterium]|nr:hypothetical protein [Phycisphaerales bacterium]